MSVSSSHAPPGNQSGAPEEAANWCWACLDAVEDRLLRMLEGIWQFLTISIPHWFTRFFRSVVRVACKLGRVTTLVMIWAAVAFVPAAVLFHGSAFFILLGLLWIGFSLAGSAWGLAYVRRHRGESNGYCRAGS